MYVLLHIGDRTYPVLELGRRIPGESSANYATELRAAQCALQFLYEVISLLPVRTKTSS